MCPCHPYPPCCPERPIHRPLLKVPLKSLVYGLRVPDTVNDVRDVFPVQILIRLLESRVIATCVHWFRFIQVERPVEDRCWFITHTSVVRRSIPVGKLPTPNTGLTVGQLVARIDIGDEFHQSPVHMRNVKTPGSSKSCISLTNKFPGKPEERSTSLRKVGNGVSAVIFG